MPETTTAPPLAWSRTFPATSAEVREARRSLARMLDGHPAADDAALCLSELATNVTMHSRSRDGGHFTVRAQLSEGCVRVEVHDQGGPWPHLTPADDQGGRWPRPVPADDQGGAGARPAPADDQHGRGLLIVASLSRNWGITGDSDTGWTVWFEIDG